MGIMVSAVGGGTNYKIKRIESSSDGNIQPMRTEVYELGMHDTSTPQILPDLLMNFEDKHLIIIDRMNGQIKTHLKSDDVTLPDTGLGTNFSTIKYYRARKMSDGSLLYFLKDPTPLNIAINNYNQTGTDDWECTLTYGILSCDGNNNYSDFTTKTVDFTIPYGYFSEPLSYLKGGPFADRGDGIWLNAYYEKTVNNYVRDYTAQLKCEYSTQTHSISVTCVGYDAVSTYGYAPAYFNPNFFNSYATQTGVYNVGTFEDPNRWVDNDCIYGQDAGYLSPYSQAPSGTYGYHNVPFRYNLSTNTLTRAMPSSYATAYKTSQLTEANVSYPMRISDKTVGTQLKNIITYNGIQIIEKNLTNFVMSTITVNTIGEMPRSIGYARKEVSKVKAFNSYQAGYIPCLPVGNDAFIMMSIPNNANYSDTDAKGWMRWDTCSFSYYCGALNGLQQVEYI